MSKRNIVVIGASAGGYKAVKELVAGLPPDLKAAIFIVWHLPPDAIGILPHVFNKMDTVPASHAVDREGIQFNHIYVAQPDYHLLLEDDQIRVTHGPKENRFRPAVDPLFRSAALAYGPRVIGIILSGALDDGTAGLWTIKQYGGIAIVQDPADAEVPSMPEHALRAVPVDYTVPVAQMASLLVQLCAGEVENEKEAVMINKERMAAEVRISLQEGVTGQEMLQMGNLTPYTCPDCHGVLFSLREEARIRYRCHTGHAFSADTLLSTVTEKIEDSLWSAIRNVEESILLLNHMGDHFAEANDPKLAATYFKKAKEADKRMQLVRQAVLSHQQLSTDSIRLEAGEEEMVDSAL